MRLQYGYPGIGLLYWVKPIRFVHVHNVLHIFVCVCRCVCVYVHMVLLISNLMLMNIDS